MKTTITKISKIEIVKASNGDDPWDGITVKITGSPNMEKTPAILKRTDSGFEDKGLPNATLANSYSVHIGNRRDNPDFVLKLPNLTGVTDSRDISDRIAEARKMFRQEHLLRQRLLPEPDILPKLLSKEDDSFTLEHKQFTGTAFYVAREYAEGRNLRRWAREAYPSSDGAFHGIAKADDWFRIAEVLLHSLADLHRERAALGFLCPDTIIVPDNIVKDTARGQLVFPRGAKFHFIDAAESQPVVFFQKKELMRNEGWEHGLLKTLPIRRSYDLMENLYRYRSESASEKWVKFALDQGSDYYSATDIFSLGVTLAFLATGEDEIISPFEYVTKLICGHKDWQIVRGCQIRRRYHVMKALLLDDLRVAAKKRAGQEALDDRSNYVDNLCRAEVILQCVRSRPDRRAQDTRHVLTSLETFGRMVPPTESIAKRVPQLKTVPIKKVLSGLREVALNDPGPVVMDKQIADFLGPKIPKQVRDLVRHRLYSVLSRIGSLSSPSTSNTKYAVNPSLRIGGSRATLVDALLGALSSIGPEQECLALTNAGIWADGNFGPISRISSMIQLLRLRGVRVQWVIVVKPIELYRPELQRILGFRRADELRLEQIAIKEKNQQRKPNKKEAGGAISATQKNRKEQKDNTSVQTPAVPPPLQSWMDDIGYFYACVDDDDYEELFRTKKSFMGLRKCSSKEQDPDQQGPDDLSPLELLIAPDLSAREGPLAALTFWVDPLRSDDLLTAFYAYKKKARSVAHFDRIL